MSILISLGSVTSDATYFGEGRSSSVGSSNARLISSDLSVSITIG